MAAEVMKVEAISDTCCVCGVASDELATLEEHDAALQLHDVPLRTQFLQLSQNKNLPSGRVCGSCVSRAGSAFEFQNALRSARSEPSLSDKIRALRRRLHDLTQKIDVFIVVGESAGSGSAPQYSEEDIILVDRAALGAAAAADDRDLEPAADARGETAYQCSVCPHSFRKAADYREHAASHAPDALHSCWTCGAQFASREAALRHRSVHERVRRDEHVCRLCDGRFPSEVEMRRHEAACPAACPACGAEHDTRSRLSEHAASCHGRGSAPPLVCPSCFLLTEDAASLSAHMLSHRRARQYVCGYDGCILRFATRSNLMSHIRKCHGGPAPEPELPEEPPARPTCARCGRTFGSVAAMKRHARVHTPPLQEEAGEGEVGQGEGEVEYLEVETLEELRRE